MTAPNDLRARLIALADANDDAMQGTAWAEHKMRYVVLTAAKMALTDYAERMDRAGQPAAAFGAVALAAGLDHG